MKDLTRMHELMSHAKGHKVLLKHR